ncbi:hypothetical protein CPB85DRAFT_1344166 [Mucidula mucida]|nr:hypothetical protein CPB85DRAFT_1344166 [Mucidula mucida]
MTTPGPLSANMYAPLLPMGQKQTQSVQPGNVPRPVPQLRMSTTEPTVGKRKYDGDEEERQAKKAKVDQTNHLQTVEEVGEAQETGLLYENKNSAALPEPKLVHGDLVPGSSVHSTESTANDSGAERRLNILKALSAEQVKRMIEMIHDKKKNGFWPLNGSTNYPSPALICDKVIGDNRARSVDDEVLTLPGPVRDKRDGEKEDDGDRSGDDDGLSENDKEPKHNKEEKERELELLFDEFVNPDAFDQ